MQHQHNAQQCYCHHNFILHNMVYAVIYDHLLNCEPVVVINISQLNSC